MFYYNDVTYEYHDEEIEKVILLGSILQYIKWLFLKTKIILFTF